eukprot:TRINITY_DN2384_c1_g1_i1.p1 TRINITY_DN2384_c1_g1~~TRINITY_DN2384_c1_g1_i1.p1  ORF type:complete len:127 (-),score=13.38 TRINITY_DN2384_c1_g1_i1:1287-1667(-)
MLSLLCGSQPLPLPFQHPFPNPNFFNRSTSQPLYPHFQPPSLPNLFHFQVPTQLPLPTPSNPSTSPPLHPNSQSPSFPILFTSRSHSTPFPNFYPFHFPNPRNPHPLLPSLSKFYCVVVLFICWNE